jgi:hypothetical protein
MGLACKVPRGPAGPRRRAGVVGPALAVLAAGGLVACGGGGPAAGARSGSTASASRAPAASPRGGSIGSASGAPAASSVSLPPLATLVTEATRLRIDSLSLRVSTRTPSHGATPASALTGTATIRLRPSLAATVDFTNRGQATLERVIGDAIYINLPRVGAHDGGRPWVAVDLATQSTAAGVDLGALLEQVRSLNPTSTLALLAARRQFHELGRSTVDGQQVVGVTGTFTPSTLSAPGLSPAVLAALRTKLAGVGATRETVTAYLTFAGAPVRTVTALTTKTSGVLVSTIDIRGINAPVNVSRPPSSQTIPLAQAEKLPG